MTLKFISLPTFHSERLKLSQPSPLRERRWSSPSSINLTFFTCTFSANLDGGFLEGAVIIITVFDRAQNCQGRIDIISLAAVDASQSTRTAGTGVGNATPAGHTS